MGYYAVAPAPFFIFALVHKYRPISIVSRIVNKHFLRAVPPFALVIEDIREELTRGKEAQGKRTADAIARSPEGIVAPNGAQNTVLTRRRWRPKTRREQGMSLHLPAGEEPPLLAARNLTGRAEASYLDAGARGTGSRKQEK